MKKLLLMFSLFLFIPILNAETTNYYDWEVVDVSSLPTASADTLNKVYAYNDQFYITQSETIGGYTPLPLDESLKDKKIYFNYNGLSNLSTYCQTLTIAQSRWFTGTSDGQFEYTRYNNSCTSSLFYVYYARVVYTNGSIYCMESNGNYCSDTTLRTNGATLYNQPNNRKAEYLIFKNDVIINSITINNKTFTPYYEMFSLTPFETTTTYSWLSVPRDLVFPITQNKIYVPTDNLSCYTWLSDNVLRGYLGTPTLNESITYYDFNIDQHYNSIKGTEVISSLPNCISNTTTNYLYRNDMVEILVFAFLVGFIVIFIPFKILMSFFKRRF